MKKITAVFLGLMASTSFASGWVEAARSKDGKTVYEYKVDSIDLEGVSSNTLATAVFRVSRDKELKSFYKEKVAHSACRAGYGSLVTYTLSDSLVSQVDYADGGGTVASVIAEFICEKAWHRAMWVTIDRALPSIDYANDETAISDFDATLKVLKTNPALKRHTIDGLAWEAHLLLVAARKKGPQ